MNVAPCLTRRDANNLLLCFLGFVNARGSKLLSFKGEARGGLLVRLRLPGWVQAPDGSHCALHSSKQNVESRQNVRRRGGARRAWMRVCVPKPMTPLASRYVPHAHTAPISVSAHVWLSPAPGPGQLVVGAVLAG